MISRDIECLLDYSDVKITLESLAKIAKMSTSTLSRFFQQEIKEISFSKLVLISNVLCADNKKLIEWCFEVRRPENIVAALEFLAVNKKNKELEELIDLHEGACNKKLKKWIIVYRLVLEYETNPYNQDYLLEKLLRSYSDNPGANFLLDILRCNIYYRATSNHAYCCYEMSKICDRLEKDIENINVEFLKETYSIRMYDVLAKNFLRVRNNVNEARRYANKNLKQKTCPLLHANALYTVGTSFLFEDITECLKIMDEAREIYGKHGYHHFVKEIELKTVPFFKAVSGIPFEEGDASEKAHFEARWGDKEKALEMLDEVLKTQRNSTFKEYYKALALNSEALIFQSFNNFIKEGDNFYANIPFSMLRPNSELRNAAEITYKTFTN